MKLNKQLESIEEQIKQLQNRKSKLLSQRKDKERKAKSHSREIYNGFSHVWR